MRTGILGGTFNPIHYGHLRPAEEVREALGLDQVRFIPLDTPAHKTEEDIAPSEDRVEMVRLALEDHPFFVCDSSEVERGGVSYTVDTLSALAEGTCRGHELFFIIGADAFSLLGTWKDPRGVLEKAHFAVTLRGEQNADEVIHTLHEEFKGTNTHIGFKKIQDNEFELLDINGRICFVPVTTLDISGTMIRNLARTGGSLRYLLPPQVEGFIIRRGLYGNQGKITARR